MPNEITFADISYSFIHDLADSILAEPKDIKIQIDFGFDYPTAGCFKAEIDDAKQIISMDGFGICIFPHESIFSARHFAVFVIAVEGQELTVAEKTKSFLKTENTPIYYYKNPKKLKIPWNFVLLVEIEDLKEGIFFKRKVELNEKGDKETFFEILKPEADLN